MILRELKLKYEKTIKPVKLDYINSPETVVKAIRDIYENEGELIEHRECFGALFLNQRNAIIGYKMLHTGGLSSTIVDIKLLFQYALLSNCTQIIVFHNHPSGALKSSKSDDITTEKIKAASKVLDFAFLDHLIITDTDYYSYEEEGKL